MFKLIPVWSALVLQGKTYKALRVKTKSPDPREGVRACSHAAQEIGATLLAVGGYTIRQGKSGRATVGVGIWSRQAGWIFPGLRGQNRTPQP